MKISLLILTAFPVTSVAFAPPKNPLRTIHPTLSSSTMLRSSVTADDDDNSSGLPGFVNKVTDTTEDVMEQVDKTILTRAMRILDHAPMLVTLQMLTNKAGMSLSWAESSVSLAPTAFAGLPTAIAIPTWCYNVWGLVALTQVLSVVKAAVSDEKVLTQTDLTATTLANWLAMRMIGTANNGQALGYTAAVAFLSGFPLRRGGTGSTSKVQVSTAALQLMSSVTTVLAVLGGISALAAHTSMINEQATTILGALAMYMLTIRNGNTTVKNLVHASVVGGILYHRLASGITYSATVASGVGALTTIGVAYVAFEAFKRVKENLFD